MSEVRIVSKDGLAMGTITTIDGRAVRGIRSYTVRSDIDDGITHAEFELVACTVDITTDGHEFMVAHPETGEMKAVSKITFTDGEEVDFK
ncbi:MAG: hypothetical protein Q9M33_10665 [Robiginitomaculum sp.]|nr:hypothetical protein [Robiginitomaculum sp.]